MHFGRRVLNWIWMPASVLLGIRRSMTGASASLLLIAIISLNIVWGYPWLGMFAATLTMLVVGIAANQWFGPRLAVQLTPPSHAVVGEPFAVTMHLHHQGSLPTFDNRLSFVSSFAKYGSKSKQPIVESQERSYQFIPYMEAGGRVQAHVSLKGTLRGIHSLPRVESQSLFPFHLFECRRSWDGNAKIAVAPAPLDREDDSHRGRLMAQISRWTQRWISGDSFDFAGNREYEVGMPVRRWDFRSWARLGRPIVQEFQSPSTRIATIIVDASIDPEAIRINKFGDQEEEFEQLLRWVATAIEHWGRLSVATRMYVSSSPVDSFVGADYQGVAELSKLMVQLASAELIDAHESESRIEAVLSDVDPKTVILFTLRNRPGQNELIRRGDSREDHVDLIQFVHVVRFESEMVSSPLESSEWESMESLS
jgi:uncharacterized protein (DUF58 family)